MSYSWGEDTGSSGAGTSSKKGFDYGSARRSYEEKPMSGRSAGSGKSKSSGTESKSEDRKSHDFSSARGKTPSPKMRLELAVKTDSTHPIVVCVDHTGSFRTEVQIILEKLPLLGGEVERYIPNYALCLALIGDAKSDTHALQVRDFDKGPALDEHIKALFPEGGGGDDPESYDLAAYYFTHHCEMSNAVKPLFIWVLDSNTRKQLLAEHIKKFIGDDVQTDLDSVEVLKKLADRFTVYVIFKGKSAEKSFWANIYGEQSIIPMEEPRDIIELMIGIIAGEAGEYDDFEKRSSKRHSDRPDRFSRVMKSTKSAKAKSAAAGGVDGEKATLASGKSAGRSLKSKKLV